MFHCTPVNYIAVEILLQSSGLYHQISSFLKVDGDFYYLEITLYLAHSFYTNGSKHRQLLFENQVHLIFSPLHLIFFDGIIDTHCLQQHQQQIERVVTTICWFASLSCSYYNFDPYDRLHPLTYCKY